MRRIFGVFAVAAVLAGLTGQAALASNGLYITTNDKEHNLADLTATGNGNALSIVQSYDGLGDANALTVSLDGDLNGGPLGAAFGGLPARLGLVPGSVQQTGHGNTIGLSVTGSSNLFAMSQIGVSNSVIGSIIGNNNQVAVIQRGMGNSLSFTQNGTGNMLSVVQQSR